MSHNSFIKRFGTKGLSLLMFPNNSGILAEHVDLLVDNGYLVLRGVGMPPSLTDKGRLLADHIVNKLANTQVVEVTKLKVISTPDKD